MKRIPVILDTDPGIDDAFCLAFALAHRDIIDLKALTTVCGNHNISVTTRNALALLCMFHAEEIPVAKGADGFLSKPYGAPCTKYHGENGLGNLEIQGGTGKPVREPAWDMIYNTAKECGGELVMVLVGPETNLAIALQKYHDLKYLIRRIVVMGGSLSHGNKTPYAEANIFNDAEAADIIFRSGIPVDMVGLDVTEYCSVTSDIADSFSEAIRPEVRDFLRGLLEYREGDPMHDAVAISTLFDESLTEWKSGNISVETGEKENHGQTFLEEGPGMHRAAVKFDFEKYRRMFVETADYFTE